MCVIVIRKNEFRLKIPIIRDVLIQLLIKSISLPLYYDFRDRR